MSATIAVTVFILVSIGAAGLVKHMRRAIRLARAMRQSADYLDSWAGD